MTTPQQDEITILRTLLARLREEAEDAWRCVDPKKSAAAHVGRNPTLFKRVEDQIGPSAWDALPAIVHIEWGARAICHWTAHAMKIWPPSQTTVNITKLITKKDPTSRNAEYVAYPEADWSGVTCGDCQRRLPTLVRELGACLQDIHTGIMEGYRTHPETIKAAAYYEEHIAPALSPERRRKNQELADKLHADRKEKP